MYSTQWDWSSMRLWSGTRSMEPALATLRHQGVSVSEDGVARLLIRA